jgi:hypothetical protein
MPAYVTSPFKPPVALLLAGTPFYFFGSYNDRTSPTFGYIISDSAVTTTGTVTFRIIDGNEPAVGEKITVRGAANSVNFNVTNGTILTESTTPDGICTVTYAISSTTQGTTSDGGQVLIPRIEVGETIIAGASVPAAVPFNNPVPDQGKVLSVTVSTPVAAGDSAATVKIQGADFDLDAEYQDIDTVATLAAGSLGTTGHWNSGQNTTDAASNPGGVNQLNYRFYRLNVSGVSGGAATIVGKIEI